MGLSDPAQQGVDWRSFFERLVSERMQDGGHAKLLSSAPWLAEFPEFLTKQEAETLIGIAQQEGLRWEDELPDTVRLVNISNCESDSCFLHPLIAEVNRRVSAMLRIHPRCFESME